MSERGACRSVAWFTGEVCGQRADGGGRWCALHARWPGMEALLEDWRDGDLVPAHVALPNLNALSEPTLRVAGLFTFVYGLWVSSEREWAEMPFVIDWVAWHVDISPKRASRARARLVARGAIIDVNNDERRWALARGERSPAGLFLPGNAQMGLAVQ